MTDNVKFEREIHAPSMTSVYDSVNKYIGCIVTRGIPEFKPNGESIVAFELTQIADFMRDHLMGGY